MCITGVVSLRETMLDCILCCDHSSPETDTIQMHSPNHCPTLARRPQPTILVSHWSSRIRAALWLVQPPRFWPLIGGDTQSAGWASQVFLQDTFMKKLPRSIIIDNWFVIWQILTDKYEWLPQSEIARPLISPGYCHFLSWLWLK